MTVRELGEMLIRNGKKLVDMDMAGSARISDPPKPMLNEDAALGAAAFLCYLRDLFTATPTQAFTQAEILVLLETCSRDGEIFPMGIGTLMWDCEEPQSEDL
jgi:hypothetical protein